MKTDVDGHAGIEPEADAQAAETTVVAYYLARFIHGEGLFYDLLGG